MLRTIDSLKGYSIRATDDELGKVEEVYFDDERWGVRYLIVRPGSWLTRQRVLISPNSVTGIDDHGEAVQVNLTREQLENSPDIDTHQPISRQMEHEHATYYGYGAYWMGPYLWGAGRHPLAMMPDPDMMPPGGGRGLEPRPDHPEPMVEHVNDEDIHLRSSDDVQGYAIAGTDGDIGHVEGFLFDDQSWAIRYLVVDTRNWWPGGKKTVISIDWIENISWTESAVQVGLTREQIKASPEYDEHANIDRDYETRLHQHYGRPAYWDM